MSRPDAERGWLAGGFFRPGDMRDLALARIVLAGFYLVWLSPSLAYQLRLAREGADAAFVPLPALKVLLLPFGGWGFRPDPWLIGGAWWISVLAAGFVLVGLWTRPATFAWAASYTMLVAHKYSFSDFHHPEAPFVIAAWIFAFSRWGDATSLDEYRGRAKAVAEAGAGGAPDVGEGGALRAPGGGARLSPEATWPLLAVQWLLAICYVSAGTYKVIRSGTAWVNGDTLAYYLIRDGIRWERPLALTLADYEAPVAALSAFTVLFELSFPLAVIFPALALAYVPAGIGMHLGVSYFMRADFPHWIALYVCFVPSLRRGWRLIRPARVAPPPGVVVYDGHCRTCLRTMVALDVLDNGDRLVFLDARADHGPHAETLRDEDLLHAMRFVDADGRVHSGFDAFRGVARRVPTLWPVLPLLHAPGSARLGPRVYARIARGRPGCATGACGVVPESRRATDRRRAPARHPKMDRAQGRLEGRG